MEPEKRGLDKEVEQKQIIEIRAPIVGPQLSRPPFDSPVVTLKPIIADSLKQNALKAQTQSATASTDG